RTDQAFVVTGDELRIEILENKDQKFPIQHHHVHFNVPESVIPQIQSWYAKTFGAKPGTRGQNQAADLPGVNLTFSKADGPAVTTRGRILDHIGFDVPNRESVAVLRHVYCRKASGIGDASINTQPDFHVRDRFLCSLVVDLNSQAVIGWSDDDETEF